MSTEARLMYAVCNRLLDAEVNTFCNFDGTVWVAPSGSWFCPACKAPRWTA